MPDDGIGAALDDLLAGWRASVPARLGVGDDVPTILEAIFGRARPPRTQWQGAAGASLSVGSRRVEGTLSARLQVALGGMLEEEAKRTVRAMGLDATAFDVSMGVRNAAARLATVVTNEVERTTMRGVAAAVPLARANSVSVRATIQRLIGTPANQIASAFATGERSDAVQRTMRDTLAHDVAQWGKYLGAKYVEETKGTPLVKRWVSMMDGREREAHRALHDTTRALGATWNDDGVDRLVPGGWNCRCHVEYQLAPTRAPRVRKTIPVESAMNLLMTVTQGTEATHVVVSQTDQPTRTHLVKHADVVAGVVAKTLVDGVYVAGTMDAGPVVFLGHAPSIDALLNAEGRHLLTKAMPEGAPKDCSSIYVREMANGMVEISCYPRYEHYSATGGTAPMSTTDRVERQGEWRGFDVALWQDGEYLLRDDEVYFVGVDGTSWQAREQTVAQLLADPSQFVGKGDERHTDKPLSCAPGKKMGKRKKKPMPEPMEKQAPAKPRVSRFVQLTRGMQNRKLVRKAGIRKGDSGCSTCTYYTGAGTCFAYSDGIPSTYQKHDVPHTIAQPGTGGFTYRRVDGSDVVTKALDMGIGPHLAQWFGDVVRGGGVAKSAVVPTEQIVVGFMYPNAKADGTLIVDRQGDVVTMSTLEKTVADFMTGPRKLGTDHARFDSGEVLESFVLTKSKRASLGLPETMPLGWVGAAHVTDPETWASIVKGERLSFSIGGTAHRIAIAESV